MTLLRLLKAKSQRPRASSQEASAKSEAPTAKSQEPRTTLTLALAVLVLCAFVGCASVGPRMMPVSVPAGERINSSENGWWYARLVMNWPEDKAPSWYLDPLLAHLVVSPILDRYGDEIVLWRFHRRAARDVAGHQFSFIFYAPPETARKVYATLQGDAWLKAMKDRGLVIRDTCDETSTISRPHLEDTSDRHWSLPIQKSWPFYIMGVSEMWLNLIREVASRTGGDKAPSGLDDALALYERVNASLEQMWREEGEHAFLHHLNAIFGYQPLMVREKRLMDF